MIEDRQAVSAHDTIATRIEQAIRRDIITGVIAPGDRLRVAELSARYGASHIPVREALRQLEGDRLVIIESRRGAVLRGASRKFVADMHDMRGALEALLTRNAARRATPANVDNLRAMALAYEAAAAANETALMFDCNRQFHRAIATLGDNEEAAHIFEKGWELVTSIRYRFGFGSTRIASIVDQHRRLVEAIAAGDADQAVAVAEEHGEGAKNDLLDQMRLAEEGMSEMP